MQRMYYKKAAGKWENGLPIGNGRLAAMFWEKDNCDILTINHERLWSGINRQRECTETAGYLPLVRDFLQKEMFFEATAAANLFFGGKGGISEIDCRVDNYQPAGNLVFVHRKSNIVHERSLELESGVARNNREDSVLACWADCNCKVLWCKWQGKDLNGDLLWEREEDTGAVCSYEADLHKITFLCKIVGGITFRAEVTLDTDGNCSILHNGVRILAATYVNVFVDVIISGYEDNVQNVKILQSDDYYEKHCRKFSELMNRTQLELAVDTKEASSPTDIRIENLRNGKSDNGLLKLYFDFGRYLLLSSCICGELPANLQGKWNEELTPPWGSDYHMNINLQMNYWMAEPLGMHECSRTLFNYMMQFMTSGKEAARKLYGCRGIWIPLQCDCWGKATPEAYGWAVWIGAAPWLVQHLWQHYLYTGDIDFLRETAYPFFKAVAEFYEDYLVRDENGIYQIMPSQSPENRFDGTGCFPVSIGVSSAMDVELAVDALSYAIQAAEILEKNSNKITLWRELKEGLPQLKIGSDGRLLEWDKESRKEVEPWHRHVSHLYALYPSDLINQYGTPDLYQAALESLQFRISAGGGYTGWSRAWTACLYGKIGDKDIFIDNYKKLITDFATDSLLDLHPPRIFQIDGNLGGTAAVIEALVSVSGGKVRLLNALPDEWKDGSIRGVYIPGGHKLSFIWKGGKVTRLEIEFGYEEEIIFIINGALLVVKKEGQHKKYIEIIGVVLHIR